MSMFHVKHACRSMASRRTLFHVKQRPLGLAALLAAVPLLVACDVTGTPDGWASPRPLDEQAETVILGSGEEELTVVEISTGAALWSFPREDDTFPGLIDDVSPVAFYASPVFSEDGQEFFVAAYAEGDVFAIRTDGSSARIIYEADAHVVADLIRDGDRLYITTADHQVIAVDLQRPEEAVWTFDAFSREVWGSAALAASDAFGGLLIVPAMDGHVYALRTDGDEAGSLAWTLETESGVASGVVVENGLAYVGGLNRTFYAIDVETGRVAWSNKGEQWFWTTALVHDGTVYVADLSGNVWAWDARDGAPRWPRPYPADDRVRAAPLIVTVGEDENLVIVTEPGDVHAIDPDSGERTWLLPVEVPDNVFANPIAIGDDILISNDGGDLFRVRVGNNALEPIYPPQQPGD